MRATSTRYGSRLKGRFPGSSLAPKRNQEDREDDEGDLDLPAQEKLVCQHGQEGDDDQCKDRGRIKVERGRTDGGQQRCGGRNRDREAGGLSVSCCAYITWVRRRGSGFCSEPRDDVPLPPHPFLEVAVFGSGFLKELADINQLAISVRSGAGRGRVEVLQHVDRDESGHKRKHEDDYE